VAWYGLGVVLPLVLAATSPAWASVFLGNSYIREPEVYWTAVAGWLPWAVALGMTMILDRRFAAARAAGRPGPIRWSQAAKVLVVVTGVLGFLGTILAVGFASWNGEPKGPWGP
jgi:hypothetical protein